MPSIEFEVWCSCGNGLCSQCTDKKGGISVEPCDRCGDTKYDEGYEAGFAEGYAKAQKEYENR